MMLWMAQQTLLLSLVCGGLLLSHRLLQQHLGAHRTYHLWLAIPALLISSAIMVMLPSPLSAVQANQLAHYSVMAGKAISAVQTTDYANLLLLTWLVGVGIMFILLLLQAIGLKRILRTAIPLEHQDAALPTLQHPSVQSPMLVGISNAKILLPTSFNRLSDDERQSIIAHEQYHHQRRDLISNLLAYLTLTVFWFNPLCWLAYRRFRDDQELSCDAHVTRALSKQQKISYSQVLLAYSQQAHHGLLHTHYGNKNILKERIMQMKTSQKGQSGLAIIGLTICLGLSGLLLNQQVQAGAHEHNEVHPLTRVEPKYPISAVEAHQSGFVKLKFDISPSGAVSNVSVIKSSPEAVFDKSAVTALEQWRYKESTKGFKGAKVQLDFMIEPPATDVERIKVTP
ncbi:TonB family protein [Shewanella pealeana]|uniref:Protein TonB n=1 Tax=Shewanella pealeana (strain ATCC 700345 / ANG-SQ1) TaxID=398579 RepID=A8H7I8_SHEPA|nr:M56 family metallopeptidase [Shewanella pealeana]ABV88525.1 TonB family protein [Shewanella pealeana ATCC 700345]